MTERNIPIRGRDQHERDASNKAFFSPRLNGIGCPECGAELYDTNPWMLVVGEPMQVNVHCEACGFIGYRPA